MSVLAALVLALAAPGAAPAAENRVSLYDVRTIITSDGRRGMLIGQELAPSVSLPAEVRITVPKGSKVAWAGEILGGDLSQDPTAPYRTEPGSEYDTIVFTLKQVRRGQVEFGLSAAPTGASPTRLEIAWRAPEAADRAQLGIQVPPGAKVSSSTPGSSGQTAANGIFYSKRFPGVAAGQRLDLAVTYAGGTAAAPTQQQGTPVAQGPANGPTPAAKASPELALPALGIILAVTFFLLNKVKPAPAPAPAHSATARRQAPKPPPSRARARTSQRRSRA